MFSFGSILGVQLPIFEAYADGTNSKFYALIN